jgi:PQQ-like domain
MKCPSCGASLQVSDADPTATCRYCGQSVMRQAPAQYVSPPQPFGGQAQIPITEFRPVAHQVASNAGGASRAFALVGCVVATFLLGAGGIFRATRTLSATSTTFAGAAKAIGERGDTSLMAWQSSDDQMPIAVSEAAGLKGEAFLTGLRRLSPNDSLYFTLVDAKTRTEIWRTPSLGTYTEAYQGSHAIAVGTHAVYTDPHNKLHILALATGVEERSGTFSDRARRLCSISPAQVIVDTSDEKPVIFDVTTGVRKPATEKDVPATCHSRFHPARSQRALPQVPGFSMRGSLSEGAFSVAWGYKSPGTSTVSVFGLDPKTQAVRWQSVLASNTVSATEGSGGEHAQLISGRLIIDYKAQNTDDENRIAAFDAATGKRLWDTGLRGIFAVDSVEGIGANETRVYVHRMGIIDILAAKNGAVEGTFMVTTYDSAFRK